MVNDTEANGTVGRIISRGVSIPVSSLKFNLNRLKTTIILRIRCANEVKNLWRIDRFPVFRNICSSVSISFASSIMSKLHPIDGCSQNTPIRVRF